MKIYLASDHAGLKLKEYIIPVLRENGVTVVDLGTSNSERVNYTDFAISLCKKVNQDKTAKGVLICGTGIGMSMMANKIRGIRAAVCVNEYMAEMAVRHNNANVLCLGERIIGTELARNIVMKFLNAEFEGGRHLERIIRFEEPIENDSILLSNS